MSNISLGFLSFENQMPVLSNIEIIKEKICYMNLPISLKKNAVFFGIQLNGEMLCSLD